MSTKKSMLIIWFISTALWVSFSFYMYDVNQVRTAYKKFEYYEEKIAYGEKTSYNLSGYKRASKLVERANKKLGLFFIIGFGFPGLMLAIGTAALENFDGLDK